MISRLGWPVFWMLGIAVLTALAYAPAMRGDFLWDDELFVKHNAALRSASGLDEIWLKPGATPQYYPLVHMSFWIEYHIWKLDTLGYHLVNIALHAGTAILIGLVLSRIGIAGAWPAAALFALHPVHVESVAWITERKNVLSGLFFAAALLAAARVFGLERRGAPTASERRDDSLASPAAPRATGPVFASPRRYAIMFLLFACALLSKSVTCSAPAVIALLIWWRRGAVTKREWLALLPMFALGVASGLLTVWVEREDVGAQGPEWALSAFDRIGIAGRAILFYLGKLIVPHDLAFIYPRWSVGELTWRQWLYPGVVAAAVVSLWATRARLGRGPLTAALYFIGVLFPALGFIDVYPMRFSFVADHFQYLASVGPIAAGAALVAAAAARTGASGRRFAAFLFIAIMAAYVVSVRSESVKYQSPELLWRDTIRENPASPMPHNNLGTWLAAHGRLEEAAAEFAETARLDPASAEAVNNGAGILVALGRLDEAATKYREAIAARPDWPIPLRSLAWIHATSADPRMRDAAEALRLAQRACEATHWRDPSSLDAMAAALAEAGRFDDAVRTATAAAQLAAAAGKKRLSREIEERLALYQRGRPFRSEPAAPASE